MPFYEYECQACKYYTEVMQKISDKPLSKCPSCGKRALKKLVSAPVFRLKGGGWYETDFKSDKENKRNLVGQEKEELKAESKPEAKDGKSEAKEAKEAKPEAKDSKESKAADSKAATERSSPARSRSASRKTRPAAARRLVRKAAAKGARKPRR
jgi:putative FmdB family regulatory protein